MMETLSSAPPIAEAQSVPHAASSNRVRWLELLLVLSISFGDSIIRSLYLLRHGPSDNLGLTTGRASYGLVRLLVCLLLLAYVLSRRGLSFRSLGLRWSLRDCAIGFPLYLAYLVAHGIAFSSLHAALVAHGPVPPAPSPRAFFGHPSWMAVPYLFANPFFEELIVRAYFMTELIDLTGSSLLAVFCSTALQFSYHLYYGWIGATGMAGGFLVFSLYYLRTRKATPIVAAHAVLDIAALIRLG
jgi:membrane protease YdiL (CAAX protease family)